MSDSKADRAQRERLLLIIEECSEVIHAATKALRHGMESTHPDRNTTNKDNLETEIGDLQFAINLATEKGDLDLMAMHDARVAKARKVGQFLHYNTVSSLHKEYSDHDHDRE